MVKFDPEIVKYYQHLKKKAYVLTKVPCYDYKQQGIFHLNLSGKRLNLA